MNLEHGGNIFAIAEARGWDWREVLDFSASINPLGPSPAVAPAIQAALPKIVHYPDREASSLVRRLSQLWEVSPGRIIVGNGATELIHFMARVWNGRRVALRIPTFSEFHRAFPQAALVERGGVTGHDLVIATNPNNPTGEALRNEANFVDESFLEFTDLPTAMHRDGTMVLRSLTKFQALPGLRIGALVGPEAWIGEWKRHREPWQVNILAEAAALAALGDKDHAERTRAYVSNEGRRLFPLLAELPGVRPLAPQANYIFATLDYPSAELCAKLLDRKILLRNCTGVPGVRHEAVRLAIRRSEDNDRLMEAWREIRRGPY